jgi:hypothetical protein
MLNKAGVPQMADGMVDSFVDKEANTLMGGNKNF